MINGGGGGAMRGT